MRKTIWTIELYFDNTKQPNQLLFKKQFNSVKEIKEYGFVGLSSNFLYDFERKLNNGLLNPSTSKKKKSLEKYKRFIITKEYWNRDGSSSIKKLNI